MGKNIKFQFTLPYKCCFYVNYLQCLIQLIYETRHPHVSQAVVCRYKNVDSTYYTRTFYKGYVQKMFKQDIVLAFLNVRLYFVYEQPIFNVQFNFKLRKNCF